MEHIRFKKYTQSIADADGELRTFFFVVLVLSDGTFRFTDFDKYIHSRKGIKAMGDNGNNRFDFVILFLNYAFFTLNVKKLDHLTADHVKDFIRKYAMCELPGDDETTKRADSTVLRCFGYVFDFMEAVKADRKKNSRFAKRDLFKFVAKRDRRGRTIKVRQPAFEIHSKGSSKQIFRDIPDSVFHILMTIIAEKHPRLLALTALSAFGGLRPSESCNVRRPDSPLGPGIMFTVSDGELIGVRIDLREELCLRSDLVNVGGIKKERIAEIPDVFLSAFKQAYDLYMKYMKGRKYEKDYAPLSVNNKGMAMTYNSYYQEFRTIIRDELVPLCLQSDDPEVQIYGKILMENNLSPHVFRHWYTVQLVLSGINEPGLLMHYRGDKSPESALAYLSNKGELAKRYRKVNSNTFDYLLWASDKRNK